MQPSICRTVVYQLSEKDATEINRRRTTPESIARRIQKGRETLGCLPQGEPIESWPIGAQAHIGIVAEKGEEFPLIIVRVSGYLVSGQVLLDGTDVLWIRNAAMGSLPGCWRWPVRETDLQANLWANPIVPRPPNCF